MSEDRSQLEQARVRLREEFEGVARLGAAADIDSAMRVADACVEAQRPLLERTVGFDKGALTCHYEGLPPAPGTLCSTLASMASGLGYHVAVRVVDGGCTVEIRDTRKRSRLGRTT